MSMIWSSNTTKASQNATAKLHDTGNLVFMDQDEKVLWQSFDYPTDTLLPGMKIGKDYSRGIEWHLSSWKSSQDPHPGAFTLGADTHGYPENKLKQGAMVKYRVGPWRNQRFTRISTFSTNLITIYNVVITEKGESFAYHVENSSMLLRVTLNSSGELDVWAGVEDGNKWQLSLKLPIDICDTYNICGAYGSCSVNTYQLSCACLDEKRFVPKNIKSWATANWSDGCVRRKPLDCKTGSDGFIKYSNVKLPETHRSWFNMSMTLEECKSKCLENCRCMGYANTDTRGEGSGCLIWFDDLIDMRVFPKGGDGRDIFVKMASSELGNYLYLLLIFVE
ncbi:hypothetical protein L1987_43702 [Smallanthus sonchifolius]|uniref:Uncharacterized protein n=1 Tax=Smallanthus sonchifolius TaxID=185202 RepID=A0ACB9GNC9_9ASTR|nr:hypothetical protein L1987_43702 [Smallanthus sonchifolius]